MAKNKGQRQKRGMLRIFFYVVLIIVVGVIVILSDAMSEELDYDIDTIKYGGMGLIGLIVLVDVAQGMLTKKRAGPPPKSYKTLEPVSSPSKRRTKAKTGKKEPAIPATKAETKAPKKEEEEYDTLEIPKPSRYAAELKSLVETRKPQERKIISYPPEVSGGKYGDCYIPIDKYTILKVRILLAQAEGAEVEEVEVDDYEGYDEYAAEDYGEGYAAGNEGAHDEYSEEGYEDGEYGGEGYDEEYSEEDYGDEEKYSDEDHADEGDKGYTEEEYDDENYEEGDYGEGDEDYSDEYDEEEEQ